MSAADDALAAAAALEAAVAGLPGAAAKATDTVKALIATDDETLATAAALHTQDAATHVADEAVKAAQAAQIVELKAELAAAGGSTPPPPPPPSKTLFGATHQGSKLPLAAMRVYDMGSTPAVWSKGPGATVPAGCLPVLSIMKNATARGWAKNATTVKAVQALVDSAPDGVYLGMCHEAEHGVYNFELPSDATLYDQDQSAFEAMVAASNAKRKTPIRTYRCIMGATVNNKAAHLDLAMASIAKHGAILGPDIYQAAQIAPAIALAKALGVDWMVPEWGNGVLKDGATQRDADVLPAMKAQAPQLVAGGAKVVCWFWSGTRNELDDKPQSQGYLRSLLAA